MIFIACIPGGFRNSLDDLAEQYLFNPVTVALTLFLGGILMIYAENRFRNNNLMGQELHVTVKQAIIIGFFNV